MPARPPSPTAPDAASRGRVRRPLRLAAVPVAGLLALALSGCGAMDTVQHMTNPAGARTYAAAADAGAHLPGWVPADATDIRLKTSYRGDGSILQFRTATAADTLGCTPAEGDVAPPGVRDTWWPDTPLTATMTCGDGWHAAAADGAVHAWLDAGSPALDL